VNRRERKIVGLPRNVVAVREAPTEPVFDAVAKGD
jgi:hypothetical protein